MVMGRENIRSGRPTDCDVSRHVRFVPRFEEKDVTSFFIAFEKVASHFQWPEDKWSFLVQTALVGKALRVWSSLSLEDSQNYQKVKDVVLKAYELVPEAYRQKFREHRRQTGQTFLEYANETERLFNEWLRAREVGENFEALKQLILLENFKDNLTRKMKTYLEEQKVETLERAATLSDEFALTHKGLYKQNQWQNRRPQGVRTNFKYQ